VPAKALGLVKRAIEGANGEIGIAVSGNGIEFRSGSVTVKTILVEGRYPNWQGVIPKAEGVAIGFQAEPFLRAVKQASIVADKESSGVVFAFAPGDCTLSTRTADVGQSKVSVPVECDGEITLTMDYRFVAQWLASLPKDSEVTMRASSKSAPTLWVSGSTKYVIMPMERN
jgi:DNA polymerase-3 subunit beta